MKEPSCCDFRDCCKISLPAFIIGGTVGTGLRFALNYWFWSVDSPTWTDPFESVIAAAGAVMVDFFMEHLLKRGCQRQQAYRYAEIETRNCITKLRHFMTKYSRPAYTLRFLIPMIVALAIAGLERLTDELSDDLSSNNYFNSHSVWHFPIAGITAIFFRRVCDKVFRAAGCIDRDVEMQNMQSVEAGLTIN